MKDYVIRQAREGDMVYIKSLQKDNKESIGFLPAPAIEARVKKNRVSLGVLNGEPCGYLLFDTKGKHVNILQACIQYDARRSLYGAALYQSLIHALDPVLVRLKCAADLASNLFWRDQGLYCTETIDGGKRRGRKINIWHHFLTVDGSRYAIAPTSQQRLDCIDSSGFIQVAPSGFVDAGVLDKLAWRDYDDGLIFERSLFPL